MPLIILYYWNYCSCRWQSLTHCSQLTTVRCHLYRSLFLHDLIYSHWDNTLYLFSKTNHLIQNIKFHFRSSKKKNTWQYSTVPVFWLTTFNFKIDYNYTDDKLFSWLPNALLVFTRKFDIYTYSELSLSPYFVTFFCSHHMHLYKCHSENPSRHNSFDDLMVDRALSDSEAGTSMFLLTEVCGLMI